MAYPKHHVPVEIDVPEDVEQVAKRRAIEANEPKEIDRYLLDHLVLDFTFNIEADRSIATEWEVTKP